MVTRWLLLALLTVQTIVAAFVVAQSGRPHEQRNSLAPQRYHVDITRLADVKEHLPPEFTAEVRPAQTIGQHDVDKIAAGLRSLTVTPPECLPASAPVDQTIGATVTGLAVNTAQYGFTINAAEAQHPTTDPPPVPGICRTVTAVAPDGSVSQTRVIPAPSIDDATTTATHSIQTVDDVVTGKTRAVDQYVYSARLDDRHLITVTSFANPADSKAAADEAQRLLIETVNTVRRHA